MKHPAQRIVVDEGVLYYAVGESIYSYDDKITQLWTAPELTPAEKAKNIENRCITQLVKGKDLIWFGEDKVLRAGDRTVELPKRPCSLFVQDETIVVGDKFGDVYAFKLPDLTLSEPVLGHVSMLTAVLMTRVGERQYIVSADRDEHIRVSSFPDGYNITSYCLGHTNFVSALLVPASNPEWLVSGGGDDYLAVWDFLSGRQLSKIACHENVMKLLDLGEEVLALCYGVNELCCYNYETKAKRSIQISGAAVDVAYSNGTVWVSYESGSIDAIKDGERIDLTDLNASFKEVEKVLYTYTLPTRKRT